MVFHKTHNLPLPRYRKMRVGLFGGSFNPPHQGHFATAQSAYRAMGLDCVLWMITPQNPLKSHKAPSCDIRQQWLVPFVAHPRFKSTYFEQDLGFYYTYQTLDFLHKTYPLIEFIMIIGADNLKTLPFWKKSSHLLEKYAFAVLARPQQKYNIQALPAFRRAKNIVFVNQPHRPENSTALRIM